MLYLCERDAIHQGEYLQLAGVSERAALRYLADFVEKSLLEPSGKGDRSTSYQPRESGPA